MACEFSSPLDVLEPVEEPILVLWVLVISNILGAATNVPLQNEDEDEDEYDDDFEDMG